MLIHLCWSIIPSTRCRYIMVILCDGAVKSYLLPLYSNVEMLFIANIILPDTRFWSSSGCMLTLSLWLHHYKYLDVWHTILEFIYTFVTEMYGLYFSRIQIHLSSLFMCPVCSIWTNRCRLVFCFVFGFTKAVSIFILCKTHFVILHSVTTMIWFKCSTKTQRFPRPST